MSVGAMRDALKNKTRYRYSEKWESKVNRMPDSQVIAVYYRLLRSGGILE